MEYHASQEYFQLAAEEEMLDELQSTAFAKSKPKMDEYVAIHGTDVIEEDLDELMEVEERFTRGINTEMAKRLELLCGMHIERSGVLGPEARAYQTHDYDDYLNHCDFIVELPTAHPPPLRFAIDVTLSTDKAVIKDKIERSFKLIAKGRFNPVKYFKGTDGNGNEWKGAIEVPRFTVVVPPDAMERFWNGEARARGRQAWLKEEGGSLTPE